MKWNLPSLRLALLALLLVLPLAACGQQPDDGQTAAPTQAQQEALAAQLKEVYDPALESFGLSADPLDYYANFWLEDLFSPEEIQGLQKILPLAQGDTAPAFYWEKETETLYAIFEDSQKVFHLYTLTQNPDADPGSADTLWLQPAAVQTA